MKSLQAFRSHSPRENVGRGKGRGVDVGRFLGNLTVNKYTGDTCMEALPQIIEMAVEKTREYQTDSCGEFTDILESHLKESGILTQRNMLIPITRYRRGRLALGCYLGEETAGVEIDVSTPRKTSITNLLHSDWGSRIIVLCKPNLQVRPRLPLRDIRVLRPRFDSLAHSREVWYSGVR